MKATLNFELPDEEDRLNQMLSCGEAYTALNQIAAYIRNTLKHSEVSEETRLKLEAVRELIPFELLERVW
jgi:hypothetical protein